MWELHAGPKATHLLWVFDISGPILCLGFTLRLGRSSAGNCWKRLDVHKEEIQCLNMTGDLSQLVVFDEFVAKGN